MKAAEKGVVPPGEVTAFTRRLRAALKFGVPLADAIAVSSEEVRNARLRQAFRRVRDLITEGAPLSEALSKESRFFPPFYIAAISQAEKMEGLPSALKHLAEELDELATTRSLVRRLARYPVIAAFVTLLVVVLSVFLLVPTVLLPLRGFKEIWDGFDTTLPATGWVFFWVVGSFLADHAVAIVLIVCGVAALISLDALSLRLFPRAQLIIERRKLRLPFYGRSFRNINLFLFCDTLGHRLKHGLRLDEALSSAQEAVRSEVFRQEIARLSGDVRLGSTLSQAMRKSEWFPLSLILAAAAGELKSQVSQAFLGMARLYSRESEYGLQRIRRAAWAWVASCAAASLLFCVASFLVAIFSFFPSLYFT